ncbi:MAG: helix-turn-helix transcriptional regulator [Clostridiales bacterium]|nr:helix-turn-helix transcriptional regulator [Clostridiales bacterium]DAQ93687.1 MAG TPA: repressor protein [Bacteriophage sp.]
MSLVNRIKMLCAKQHISLHRLEMTIGFSKSSISKWDVNAPSVEKVLRVAEYFNVSMDFLLGRRSAASPNGLFLGPLSEEEHAQLSEYLAFLRSQIKL